MDTMPAAVPLPEDALSGLSSLPPVPGRLRAEPPGDVVVGVANGVGIGEAQPHSADVGLVLQARGGGLHDDGEPDRLGRGDRVVGGRRGARGAGGGARGRPLGRAGGGGGGLGRGISKGRPSKSSARRNE